MIIDTIFLITFMILSCVLATQTGKLLAASLDIFTDPVTKHNIIMELIMTGIMLALCLISAFNLLKGICHV